MGMDIYNSKEAGLEDKCFKIINRMCKFKEWKMSIPPSEDDSDMALCRLLNGFSQLRKARMWAEGLIRQLPKDHEGRNSWLLNHGESEESFEIKVGWIVKNEQLSPDQRIKKLMEILK